MNTIFNIIDLDIYFLDFLNIDSIRSYLLLSRKTYSIFKLLKYYKESYYYLENINI